MSPSATATPTSAPAAPASGSGDPFEGARLPGNEETASGPTPTPQPPAPAAATPPAELPPSEPAPAPTEPEPAQPATAAPPKVWAEKFKTPEELEIAYKHSSTEGRRLAAAIKDQQQANETATAALKAELTELKMSAEAGPEIAEPTEQELEAMGPVKAMRLMQKISERKALTKSLKEKKEARESEAKRYDTDLRAHINQSIAQMKGNSKDFPKYIELQEEMGAIMDMEEQGPQNGPLIMYLAAYGRDALRQAAEATKKSSESTEQAKAKAKAAAVVAGAPGGSGSAPGDPGGGAAPDPDSDEAHNQRLIAAANRRNLTL